MSFYNHSYYTCLGLCFVGCVVVLLVSCFGFGYDCWWFGFVVYVFVLVFDFALDGFCGWVGWLGVLGVWLGLWLVLVVGWVCI